MPYIPADLREEFRPRLIASAPEVDEEFVEKWVEQILIDLDDCHASLRCNLVAMLREAGVTVKGE